MKSAILFLSALLPCLVPMAPARADFAITYAESGSSMNHTIYIHQGKVRVTNRKGKRPTGGYMIYDSRRKAMTSVNLKDRNYVVMTEKQLDQIRKDMPTAEDIVAHRIKRKIPFSSWLPDSMTEKPSRAAAKPIVKGVEKTAPKVLPYEKRRVVKTRHKQTIKGIRCTNHRIYQAKKRLGVLCVASRRVVKMSKADYRALKAFHKFFVKVVALTKKAAGPFAYRIDDFIMTRVKGVPLYSKESKQPRLKATRISRKRLSGKLFTVPKGYKKQEM